MRPTKSLEQFNHRLKEKLDDGEDYTITESSSTGFVVVHKCGTAYNVPNKSNLFAGYAKCPTCFTKQRKKFSTDSVREYLLSQGYSLKSAEYVNDKEKISIEHIECGHVYDVKYNLFRNGRRCPNCFGSTKLTLNQVKEHIEQFDGYELLSTEYVNNDTHLRVKHTDCGNEYDVKYSVFKNGRRCPKCACFESSFELKLCSFLEQHNIEFERHYRYMAGSRKEFDIYVPSKKLAIECNGIYWHRDDSKGVNFHLEKTQAAEELGIQLIHIFDDEISLKSEIVFDRIKTLLGIIPNRVYARKCTIRHITASEKNEFLTDNHIQGKDICQTSLGLFLEDELLSVMTFTKTRNIFGGKPVDGDIELSRFATKMGYSVVGGFSKLISFYTNNVDWTCTRLFSYADRRWSIGKSYYSVGFKLESISKPSYWYSKDGINRFHRYKFRKSNLSKLFPETFDENKTEREIMRENKYYTVHDCGQLKFSMLIR